jgi:hypothetical protein
LIPNSQKQQVFLFETVRNMTIGYIVFVLSFVIIPIFLVFRRFGRVPNGFTDIIVYWSIRLERKYKSVDGGKYYFLMPFQSLLNDSLGRSIRLPSNESKIITLTDHFTTKDGSSLLLNISYRYSIKDRVLFIDSLLKGDSDSIISSGISDSISKRIQSVCVNYAKNFRLSRNVVLSNIKSVILEAIKKDVLDDIKSTNFKIGWFDLGDINITLNPVKMEEVKGLVDCFLSEWNQKAIDETISQINGVNSALKSNSMNTEKIDAVLKTNYGKLMFTIPIKKIC